MWNQSLLKNYIYGLIPFSRVGLDVDFQNFDQEFSRFPSYLAQVLE